MHIPGIGTVQPDPKYDDTFVSSPLPIPLFRGQPCCVFIEGYAHDPRPDDFHSAIEGFLALSPDVLIEAQPHVLKYCEDIMGLYEEDETPDVRIEQPSDVWNHVRFGSELEVSRRADGDDEDGIYFSLECDCDWEIEHGLQIVVKDGTTVWKIGLYDGHRTNSDAFDDPTLSGVIYKAIE